MKTRRFLAILLAVVLAASLLAVPVSAKTKSGTCGENVTWTLDDQGTLTISGTGAMTNYSESNAPWYSDRLDIQTVVIKDGVTLIGSNAFRDCKLLTSVTIPDNVTSIGERIFSNCSSLTSVTIGNGVTNIKSGTFWDCGSLTSVTIGNSVTSIGIYAFYSCSSLASVMIPDSVTSIGDSAFMGCRSLTNMTIPDSVTSIGADAFSYCSSLASVTIPNSVKSIESASFVGCSSLTSVTIPNSVKSIGSSAFSGCSSLTSVTVGSGVKLIETRAFNRCNTLADIYYTGTEEQWNAILIQDKNEPLLKAARHYNPVPPQNNPFTDVAETAYFYQPVLWAYNAEPQVTNGVDDTHFGPDRTVTRGQAVTFLWRAMGQPEPRSADNPFTDVKTGDYYYNPVLWAVENGVTNGTDATHFTPEQTCSTAHILTFLYRTLGLGENGWYEEAGAWAAENGLLKDIGKQVHPDVLCPRGDMVTFLYRVMGE